MNSIVPPDAVPCHADAFRSPLPPPRRKMYTMYSTDAPRCRNGGVRSLDGPPFLLGQPIVHSLPPRLRSAMLPRRLLVLLDQLLLQLRQARAVVAKLHRKLALALRGRAQQR